MVHQQEDDFFDGYESTFEHAVEELKQAGAEKKVSLSDAHKLQLYSLYKQALEGDCKKSQPSAFQVVERAKWTEWNSLKGMSKVVAKRKYVALVKEILPSIQVPTVPQTFSASPRSQQHITNLRHRGNKLYAHANGASSPRMRRVVQHVPSLSYTKIWLQIISLFFMIAIILATFSYFAPMLLAGKLSHLKSSLPFVWLSIGYIFVLVVRPRVFKWRLLQGEVIWYEPIERVVRVVQEAVQLPAFARPSRPELPAELKELGLELVHSGTNLTPQITLRLKEKKDTIDMGSINMDYPYSIEQVQDIYYRMNKEPLPDPAMPKLLSISTVFEKNLEEYDAVVKERLLRFKNTTPYIIRKFLKDDFIEYKEISLWDKRNRILQIYTTNASFSDVGLAEDYSTYKVHKNQPNWTSLEQKGRLSIFISIAGFIKSKIVSFAKEEYVTELTLRQQYHMERLVDEYGQQ